MHSQNTVAAIVVTFNRKVMLSECLMALLQQTQPVDAIIVVDNCSTDGTTEHLVESGLLSHPKIQYHRLETNTGGAGGFSRGVQLGLDVGHDWLWLMDDDVEPSPDCLEQLLNGHGDVRVPLRLARDGVEIQDCTAVTFNFRNPFKDFKTDTIDSRYRHKSELPAELEVEDTTFEGPMIRRSVAEQLGPPRAEFFIIGDDTDYAIRARKVAGAKIVLLSNAILIRKIPPQNRHTVAPWKYYYSRRNSDFIVFRNAETPLMALRPFMVTFGRLASDLARLKVDQALIKIRFQSLWDALLGRFPYRYRP